MIAGAAIAAAFVATAASAAPLQNLLTNGSFEQGVNGWNPVSTGSGDGLADPVVIAYNQRSGYPTGAYGEPIPTNAGTGNPGFDAVGNNALYLSTDVGTNELSQTVSLLAGTTYVFGFDYYLPANGYGNPNDATLTASLAGETFATFALGSQAPTQWHYTSASKAFGSATSGVFKLTFSGNGFTAKDVVIDRVFLATVAAVPEPATWALMLTGFGMVGCAMRRRKARTSVRFA